MDEDHADFIESQKMNACNRKRNWVAMDNHHEVKQETKADKAARLQEEKAEAKAAEAKAAEVKAAEAKAAEVKAAEVKAAEAARLMAEQEAEDAAAEAARLKAEQEAEDAAEAKAAKDELDVANKQIVTLQNQLIKARSDLLNEQNKAKPDTLMMRFTKAELESFNQQCKLSSKGMKNATQQQPYTGTVIEGAAGKVTYMCSLPTNEMTGGEFSKQTGKIEFQVTPFSEDVQNEKILVDFNNQMTKSGDHKKGEALKGALKFIPSTDEATLLACSSITIEDGKVKLCFSDGHDFTFVKNGNNWAELF
jgi:chemotaxis protein histidine kinase CheA